MNTPRPPRSLSTDPLRDLLAAIIAVLTLGGWVLALASPRMRTALANETGLWWAEQLILFVQAIVCVGVVIHKRAVLMTAIMVSVLVGLLDILRWWQDLAHGQLSFPLTSLLNVALLWRLAVARRAPVTIDAPVA